MKHLLISSFKRLKETNILSNFVNLGSIQLSNALLLILIYPIITRIVGIEEFGFVMLANTFAGISSIAINFGTNQSGVRDIAINLENRTLLRKVFYSNLWLRFYIFVIFVVFLWSLQWFNIRYYSFILLATPIVVAELINPLFFFLGSENLKAFNFANLFSKFLTIVLVIIFIKGPNDSQWVNFIMGTSSTLIYAFLLGYAIFKNSLTPYLPSRQEMMQIGKENLYLTINNLSVHLQQSFIIFAIAKWGHPAILGAYTLCDKIIWSSRVIIISISNAIYPKATQLYQEKAKLWEVYQLRMKKILFLFFFSGSLFLCLFSNQIIYIIAGETNHLASLLLKFMAFLPTLAALNSLNVLDLLIKNEIVYIFRIALFLILISSTLAFILVKGEHYTWLGIYTLLVELAALLMYEYTIKKSNQSEA